MFDMKTEDFEQLKKLCQENDFEIDGVMNDEGVYFIRKKDPWDGVEFAENKATSKIIKLDTESKLIKDDKGNYIARDCYIPSTESAYVEQLKKEAFERFGEIKEGDRFDRTIINEKWGDNTAMQKCPFENFYWKYDKSSDTLFKGRFGIYSKGKWATRVKERVEVKFDGGNLQSRHFFFTYGKDAEHKMVDLGCFKVGEFLASQLEAYLNGEIHESVSVKELEKIRKQFFDKFK